MIMFSAEDECIDETCVFYSRGVRRPTNYQSASRNIPEDRRSHGIQVKYCLDDSGKEEIKEVTTCVM